MCKDDKGLAGCRPTILFVCQVNLDVHSRADAWLNDGAQCQSFARRAGTAGMSDTLFRRQLLHKFIA